MAFSFVNESEAKTFAKKVKGREKFANSNINKI